MGKVLVASIGDPRLDPKTREYRQTTYVLSDGQNGSWEYTSSYIFEALVEKEGINKLILIGTAGSLWNALYEYLCLADESPLRKKDLQGDDDYLAVLNALHDENKKDKSKLDVSVVAKTLEKLQASFNPNYHVKIIVMRYGLSDAEWDENLNVLREIEDALEDGDELYLDVTYSFRSLPIFQMLAISYFRNISRKNIHLRMMSYGMYDARDEFGGSTPIIDLRRLYELMEYIKVAGEYKSFGTAYGLDGLLAPRAQFAGFSPEQQNLIKNLGDTVCINNMNDFQKLVKNCKLVLSKEPAAGREFSLLARAIFADIQDYFGEGIGDPIMTQFNLAKWHMEKKRYLNAITTARETCVTFAMNLHGGNGSRDQYSKLLVHLDSDPMDEPARQFVTCYAKVRRVRNMLAHPTPDFTNDERMCLVEILVCDELRSGDQKKAEKALCDVFSVPGGQQLEECILVLEEKVGATWAQNAERQKRLFTLATKQLPDPFKAVLVALRTVIERLHACYQQNYFQFNGNASAAGNREKLKTVLDDGWEKWQANL